MSRDRARNDRNWSKKSKRQICEENHWEFVYLDDAPKGAGWYTEDDMWKYGGPYFSGDKNTLHGCKFSFGRYWERLFDAETVRDWYYCGSFEKYSYCEILPDPVGPFPTLEDAVEWVYRVQQYYKGRPDNFKMKEGTYGFTARHSEVRRGYRKARKSGERWEAKRNIQKDIMISSD